MNAFLKELEWRGMIHDHTPGVETLLADNGVIGYIGFDPTAASLTIGNYVQIMLLSFFQRCGHQPIMLMGGATGRIGDPSGKDKERQLKSFEELDANLDAQIKQAQKFLNFEDGANKALLVNNHDFYKEMNVLDFLRTVGKNLTVNYMLSKESVKKRLESGISYTEFSYQLLQAYDFLCLYRKYGCKIQMGGSDQWGNITSGTEFIRRNIEGAKAYAVTTPLLTKADGSKFGKSESGNIWLDPTMTTPYQFFQFWINADDRDLAKFLRYFSFKDQREIEALESEHNEDPRKLKKILAEELTIRVHGELAHTAVQHVSELLFAKNMSTDLLKSFDEDVFIAMSKEIPSFKLAKDVLSNDIEILSLLSEHTKIVQSKGDGRRAIQGNAISVNKQKVQSLDYLISKNDLLCQKYIIIENGKKNKFLVELV